MANITDSVGVIAGALTAAISGGLFTKWIEGRLRLKEKAIDGGTQLREELREDVHSLKAEVQMLRKEVESWQSKYLELNMQYAEIKADNRLLQARFDELNRATLPRIDT